MVGKIRNRLTKCKATGEEGYTLDFYRSESGEYFKSEEVYREYRAEIDAYNEVKLIIDEELMGYDPNLPYNSLTPYNLKRLKGYSNVVILETVKRYYDDILYSLQKKNITDASKRCSYIFAIIKSHAIDVKKDLDKEKQAREKIIAKASDESLADKLMVEALNTNQQINKQQGKKDISAFLSEEEIQ